VDSTKNTLLRAGAKDQLLADFTAMCEATTLDGLPKYTDRPTLETLAKFITAQSGGPNKDMALLELAHLVYGVGKLLGQEAMIDFFLSPRKATPANMRVALEGCTALQDVDVQDAHMQLRYDDKTFDVRLGRIPFLVCLYEFLCSMDGFAHFGTLSEIFDHLLEEPLSDQSLRQCANAIASVLRKYRMANLASAEADGKFIQVYKFLQNQSQENQIILQDNSVLDFWCLHNKGKDYRGYRTVFDLFCDFTKSFEEAKAVKASNRAQTLGVNWEDGEIDVAEGDIDQSPVQDWVSPFDVFDEDDFNDLRFFKKKTERAPIENLMRYGPDALRLPLAFIRYEIFGQVQSGITNDLQVGRGQESIKRRISCEEVPSYQARLQESLDILNHIKQLQASTLHVLAQATDSEKVVAFPSEATQAAQKSFSKMNRKGFDANAVENLEAFKKAASSLVEMERQLDQYIASLQKKNIPEQFEGDRQAFSNQFSQLYEEAIK
jgi:hypothetical protein